MLDLSPFTQCSKHEDRHDCHPSGRNDRAEERTETEWYSAITAALQLDEGVPDQSTCEPADDDGGEGREPRAARW